MSVHTQIVTWRGLSLRLVYEYRLLYRYGGTVYDCQGTTLEDALADTIKRLKRQARSGGLMGEHTTERSQIAQWSAMLFEKLRMKRPTVADITKLKPYIAIWLYMDGATASQKRIFSNLVLGCTSKMSEGVPRSTLWDCHARFGPSSQVANRLRAEGIIQ